jgi:hypothetical protein
MAKRDNYVTALLAALAEYGKGLDREGQLLVEAIRKLLAQGMPVSKAVTTALQQNQYREVMSQGITDSVYKMALTGYGIATTIRVNAAAQANIAKTLTEVAWASDNMKLSARLHGTEKAMRQAIVSTIQTSLNKQEGLRKLSQQLYDGYNTGKHVIQPAQLPKYLQQLHIAARQVAAGNTGALKDFDKALAQAKANIAKLSKRNMAGTPNTNLTLTYKKLVKEAELITRAASQLNTAALDRAVWTAVQEKSRFYADRLARSENSRAWFDGFILETQNDDLVWGYRWVLSNRHKYMPFDQCDVCANIDVGYGKGVYPKDKVPSIPRHPHCMCSLEAVYFDEIDITAPFNPDGARKYIDSLTDQQKQALFGIAGAKAYEQGTDWQKLLRGWGGFENPASRLKAKDIAPLLPEPPTREERLSRIKEQKWNSLIKPDDLTEVHKVLNNATDAEVAFWEKYGHLVDGNFYHDNGAYYHPGTRKVYLKLDRIDARMKRIKGKSDTRVFFHEVGHLFDANVFKETSDKRLFQALPDLVDKLESDFINYANKLFAQLGEKSISSLYRISQAQKEILNTDLLEDRDLKNAISDIIEGLTNARVGGHSIGHYGHGKDYWKYPDALEKETIAHLFEASMLKGERLGVIKRYFPKAYEYAKAEFDRLGV